MISLFCSAVNVDDWPLFMNSLDNNECEYEVVFVGPNKTDYTHKNLVKIVTKNIKPAQCYEIGARESKGDIIGLTCDDVVYEDGYLDGIHAIFDQNKKDIVVGSDIDDRGGMCSYESYTLGDEPGGYIMCSMGFFRKQLWERLGRFDVNFISGQYENDFFMRCHKANVEFVKYSDKTMKADHDPKSRFSLYHDHGRTFNHFLYYNDGWKTERKVPVEGYTIERIKEVSQGPKGEWE